MRLSLSIAAFTLITSVTALPSEVIPRGEPQFPLLDSGMTIKEAARKCGDKAQLSCCGKAVKAGDRTSADEGIGAGLLSNLAGGGSGDSGILAFDQCSKLDVQITILILPIQDLLNQHCKQNVACCQTNGADASSSGIAASLPCIALGSIA
ncbi:hydrophobin [Aspergillus udagawae]|uniref:Hydrophobin n=1 Tax=Aspergillus udagawae TaxID=91492 RepID=A0A8H3PAM9_9EURO|nr:hydrophobin [Aspergillus udagawae]